MKNKLIFLLLSIALVLAKDQEFSDSMDKLESTKFGRTILQTIYMQLQTDDPVAHLIDILQSLQTQLEADQRKDDDHFERVSLSCEQDQAQLTQVLNQAILTSKQLKSDLDQLVPQKQSSVHALNRKVAETEDLTQELAQQTQNRQKQIQNKEQELDEMEKTLYQFNNIKSQFNQYLDILQKNRRRFNKPEAQDSFLQKSRRSVIEDLDSDDDDDDDIDYRERSPIDKHSNFAQLASSINKVKHNVKDVGFKALLQLLSQITTQLHTEMKDESDDAEFLTKKILAVVKQIEQYIQDQRQFVEGSDEARANLFDVLEKTYSDQIVQGKQDQSAMQGLIESLSSQIQGITNEKFEVDQKTKAKSNEKSDRNSECLEFKENHQAETNKRQSERAALSEALDLITSKLGQLKKHLLEKGGY